MAAAPEAPSPVPHAEYVESVLDNLKKPVEKRAALTREFLSERQITPERFAQMLRGARVALPPSFDFNDDRVLTRAVLDLQERVGFPQVDNAEGQDGIFGKKTFEAAERILQAETESSRRREGLRTEVGPGDKLVLEEGLQPGLADALRGVEGERWAGKLKGNGNREVAIFIPRGVDTSKPVELIYHFHGVNGHLIGPDMESTGRNRLEQVLGAAQRMAREGRNIVVVYPLSAGHRARAGGRLPGLTYDADWMRKDNASGDDMDQLHAEVLSTIGTQFGHQIQIESITAKGHSAGGTPLVNMAKAGFRLDRIDFLDASYGGRISWCYPAAVQNNPNVELNIFLIRGSKTDNAPTRSVEGKPGVRIIEAGVRHGLMNQTYFGWRR